MNIYNKIAELVEYGVKNSLIEESDRKFIINSYLNMFKLESFEECDSNESSSDTLEELLNCLCKYAYEKGLIPDDGVTQCDLFDTGLMAVMTDRPSNIIKEFNARYKKSPQDATDWYYDFSKKTNYIRADRVKRDRKWMVDSEYGKIDITINLSKPEKDPKAIAAARSASKVTYPKCQLCVENEGYAGRLDHPARQNHRIIPIEINGSAWGFQYSPYVYYNEHCIVFNGEHTPMKIDKAAFKKLFSFVEQFPHYFLGSNADLPIVGGSILTHDHFQGGHYEFAMERAGIEKEFKVPGFEDVSCGIVHWPLSVIRISSPDKDRLIDLADHILGKWRSYSDEEAFVFAYTDGEPHNTITPIARKRGEMFELDLALRNNITTDEHPLGVYHPHSEYHHIKKENIGLIEVMGLAVLPARLDKEMKSLSECLVTGGSLLDHIELEKHQEWVNGIIKRHPDINKSNVDAIIEEEIGQVFVKVLENAGVYKCNEEGRAAFMRFIETL